MEKKKRKTSWIIALTVMLSVSLMNNCSKGNKDAAQNTSAFTLDGTEYSINLASLQIQSSGSGLSNAVIILTGGKESAIGTISFIASFSNSAGISGTYTAAAGGNVGTSGTYASHLAVYSIQNGSDIQTGGYATGPVKITDHGSNEYTVEFTVSYGDAVEASAKIKRTFTLP